MFAPKGFSSIGNYIKFCLARSYVTKESRAPFHYPNDPFYMERIGDILSRSLSEPLHYAVANLYNPVFITGFTFSAMGVATLIYYPKQVNAFLEKFIPQAKHINPHTAKFALFAFFQFTILGIGIRALGRLNNLELRNAWRANQIEALQIGGTLNVPN